MKKFLWGAAAAAILVSAAWWQLYRRSLSERHRAESNYVAASAALERSLSEAAEQRVTIEALRLTESELERLHAAESRKIRELGVRLKRAESYAVTATANEVAVKTERRPVSDTLSRFEWADAWTAVRGTVTPSAVECLIDTRDTIRQVVHRVPYRWWIFRWGTKGISQTIASSNPRTLIVYAEYISLERVKYRE